MIGADAFKRSAKSPLGMAGLTLLAIGVLAACAAGVVIGMLAVGNPSNRTTLEWLLLWLGSGALLVAVIGNYLWYRARLADRSRT